jgi:D-alanine-D-alanine ligase
MGILTHSTMTTTEVSPSSPPKPCVVSGGTTAESSASRISAAGVHAALAASGYDAVWLDLSGPREWAIRSVHRPVSGIVGRSQSAGDVTWLGSFASLVRAMAVDVVFPTIHGPIGEDGQLQTLCKSLSLPCVGCDSAASMACYDKAQFKRLVRDAGLPIAPWIAVRKGYDLDDLTHCVARELGYPCIVKPACSGSSLGLARVEMQDELRAAIVRAFAFGEVVLVEQMFYGVDVEIGVLAGDTLTVGSPVELEYDGILYDYDTKYAGDRDRRFLPARFPETLIGSLMKAARDAFLATACDGMARVDFLVDPDAEQFVVNEINTVPYMPESSTFTTSLCHATGQTYSTLISELMLLALAPGRLRSRGRERDFPTS